MPNPELTEFDEIETDPFPSPEALLFTQKELAARLSISERHCWDELKNGRIGVSVLRFGRSVRFLTSEVAAWMAASCPNREEWARMKKCKTCLASFEMCPDCRKSVAITVAKVEAAENN